MLKRVLEPEAMDTPQEAEAYDSMDHAAVNRRFVDDLLAFAETCGPPGGEVLDLGTGTARIPIELCARLPDVRTLAIDLSDNMLALARQNSSAAGLQDRIELARVDAKGLPYEDGRFWAVISNSIVHHIPEPAAALAEAVRTTAPGGLLFFRDLLRPPDDAAVKRLVHAYARDETAHQQSLLEASLRASLDLPEIRRIVARLGFDPASVRTTSDRHWTWAAKTN